MILNFNINNTIFLAIGTQERVFAKIVIRINDYFKGDFLFKKSSMIKNIIDIYIKNERKKDRKIK